MVKMRPEKWPPFDPMRCSCCTASTSMRITNQVCRRGAHCAPALHRSTKIHRIKILHITKKDCFFRSSLLCRHRPIFPGRRQPSIVGTGELNFRVRYGNGWTLTVISTDYQVLYHKSLQFAIPAPSKLNKDRRSKAHTSLSLLVPFTLWSSPRLISTSQLNALLHLHLWPINQIVYLES